MTNLFPNHLDWTEDTCHYVAAIDGFRQALIAGPYRTAAEANSVLNIAQDWALHASGDPKAADYHYRVLSANTGHQRSILGELPTDSGALTRFDAYEINPCRRWEEPDSPGHFYYEVCEPAEADVWTLYGHVRGHGVQAIGDFDTFDHAAEVFTRITGKRNA